jgi:hypothetical protein
MGKEFKSEVFEQLATAEGNLQGEESEAGVQRTGLSNSANSVSWGCGIPVRLAPFRPAQSTSPEWDGKYTHIKSKIDSGALFGVCGGRGSGKSQLGVCSMGYVATVLFKKCEYHKSQNIFLSIREAMRTEGDSEKKAIERFCRPFLLVIDAYEVRSDSDFENRMMDHIIDMRYDSMKSTIIISNDNIESFVKFLGPSTVDRMAQTGGVIELKNKSFRRI